MINDLFFHIHYCNGNKLIETDKFSSGIVRTLQHHELMFICNGSGSCIVGGKRYLIKSGMLLYITPDVPFSIDLDTKVPAGCLTVHFSYANVSFNDGKWDIKRDTLTLPLHPAQELQDSFLVEEQFQKLVDSWNAKLPGYEFVTRTMFQQLIIAITQNLNKQSHNFATSFKIKKIIQYMRQNINGKITLPELSKFVQMTPAYMSRTFKETTGYTIIEYFNKLKIDKAKELLIESNKKVKEVSQELGFADEFYFSRMFKKSEGISPSEFYSRIVHEL